MRGGLVKIEWERNHLLEDDPEGILPTTPMVYPNPQIYPHLKTIFVHVPKTAGTAIERELRETPHQIVGGHTTALGYKRKFPEEFSSYFTFTVVRHPLTRFLSAWRYLRSMPVNTALNNATIHESDSFGRWMGRVREDPEILKGTVHLIPQHRFICDGSGGILVGQVYRFENLDTEWPRICAQIGLPAKPLAHLNQAKIEMPEPDCIAEAMPFIAETYSEDFNLGGYRMEDFEIIAR